MFRTAILFILSITFSALPVLADAKPAGNAKPAGKMERLQHVELPTGATVDDTPAQDDVIEAVGTVNFSTVPIYTEADKKSKVLRYAIPGEKVTIVASNEQWFAVRLYNAKTGFIEQHNVKTVKVFYDERVGANHMNKRINVELREMVDRFNTTLQGSVYVRKYEIIPQLTLVSTAKKDSATIITMEYCAVDLTGSIVPSRQDNVLHEEVKSFIELIFMKLLPSMSDTYIILIRKPDFSPKGQVLNTKDTYVQLKLEHKDITPENVRDRKHPENRLLAVVESDISMDKLFKDFPN